MFKQKLSKLLSSTLVLSMLFTAAPNITFADNTKIIPKNIKVLI